ncbi:hypothetical protein DMUE_6238, partial [Dictyocoela muelleri]
EKNNLIDTTNYDNHKIDTNDINNYNTNTVETSTTNERLNQPTNNQNNIPLSIIFYKDKKIINFPQNLLILKNQEIEYELIYANTKHFDEYFGTLCVSTPNYAIYADRKFIVPGIIHSSFVRKDILIVITTDCSIFLFNSKKNSFNNYINDNNKKDNNYKKDNNKKNNNDNFIYENLFSFDSNIRFFKKYKLNIDINATQASDDLLFIGNKELSIIDFKRGKILERLKPMANDILNIYYENDSLIFNTCSELSIYQNMNNLFSIETFSDSLSVSKNYI